MKNIIITTFFILSLGKAICQTRELDSLKNVISTTTEDTTRVLAMSLLSFYTENVDSCLKIDYKALALAKEIGFRKGEAKCLNQLGNDFWNSANYPKAMDYYFQSLKINEEIGDLAGMSANYGNISNIYSIQEDFPTALKYAQMSVAIRLKIRNRLNLAYLILASIYEKMNMPDSALVYYSRSYELFNTTSEKYQLSSVLSGLGNVHSQMGHKELAFAFYRSSIAASPPGSEDFSKSYYGLALLFKQEGRTDSSLLYAQKGITAAALWPEMFIKCALYFRAIMKEMIMSRLFIITKKPSMPRIVFMPRESNFFSGTLVIMNRKGNRKKKQRN
jgi:tetratricopeptide (TPR) repeat protein